MATFPALDLVVLTAQGRRLAAALLLSVCCVGAAQPVTFEAASVRKRQSGASAPSPMRMLVTPGRISFQAVLNRTGLQDDYAFTMAWTAETGVPLFGPAGADAVRQQLGLSLEMTTAPVTSLIVESVAEAVGN